MSRARFARAPLNCTSYEAGHTVHWIQALHVANKPEVRARSVQSWLLDISQSAVNLDLPDGVRQLRNHDLPRLASIAGALPRAVTWNERYVLLKVDSYLFSMASAELGALTPCLTDDVACQEGS